MNGIQNHEMTRLTHSARPNDPDAQSDSLDHTIQMPGPDRLNQLSHAQQFNPDLSMIFGFNGYISGTGIALIATHGADTIDMTAGVGIVLLSMLGTYRLLRISTSNFDRTEGCRTNVFKYLVITGVVATLGCLANFGHLRCR